MQAEGGRHLSYNVSRSGFPNGKEEGGEAGYFIFGTSRPGVSSVGYGWKNGEVDPF